MRGFPNTLCGLGTGTASGWQQFDAFISHVDALTIVATVVLALIVIFYLVGAVAVVFWVFTTKSHLSIKVDMVVESLSLHSSKSTELGITNEVIKRAGSKVFMSAPENTHDSSAQPDKLDDKIKDEPYYAKLAHEHSECTIFDPATINISIDSEDCDRAYRKIPGLKQLGLGDPPGSAASHPSASIMMPACCLWPGTVLATLWRDVRAAYGAFWRGPRLDPALPVTGNGTGETGSARATPGNDNDLDREFSYADLNRKGMTHKLSTLVPNSKLGNRLIANLMVQHFVDLLAIVFLTLNFRLLYTLQKASKYVTAVLSLQIGIFLCSKLCYSIIMTAFTQPVIANAVDGLAQRNGICYRKQCAPRAKTNVHSQGRPLKIFHARAKSADGADNSVGRRTSPVNTDGNTSARGQTTPFAAPAQTPLEASQEHLKWMSIVWNTRSEDPRRNFWCQSEGIGVQYSEAIDAAEDAHKLTDDATQSAMFLCVTYITGTLATIAVYLAGYDVVVRAPVTVLSIVVALASSTLSYSCLSLAQLANAAVHARRSRATLTSINEEITLASVNMVRRWIFGAVLDEKSKIVLRRSVWGRLGYMSRFIYIPIHLHIDKRRSVECKIAILNTTLQAHAGRHGSNVTRANTGSGSSAARSTAALNAVTASALARLASEAVEPYQL